MASWPAMTLDERRERLAGDAVQVGHASIGPCLAMLGIGAGKPLDTAAQWRLDDALADAEWRENPSAVPSNLDE